LILSDDFEVWQSCANYCTIIEAAVAALKEFNSKQPCMTNVYIIMRALRHHLAALNNTPFNMPGQLVDPLEVALRKRVVLVYSDFHYAGDHLNPHFIYDMNLRVDQYAMAGLIKVFMQTLLMCIQEMLIIWLWD
jgi:hypothetical protein